jgi:hypothetical protein
VIGLLTGYLVDVVDKGDVFILVYNFYVPLAFEGQLSVPWSRLCYRFTLYLPVCWSDGYFFFVVLRFLSFFFFVGVYFVVSQSWCGVPRLVVEF